MTHRTKALLLLYMSKATAGRHFTSGKSRRHDNDDAAIRPSRDQNRVRDFSRIWARGYHGDCHAQCESYITHIHTNICMYTQRIHMYTQCVHTTHTHKYTQHVHTTHTNTHNTYTQCIHTPNRFVLLSVTWMRPRNRQKHKSDELPLLCVFLDSFLPESRIVDGARRFTAIPAFSFEGHFTAAVSRGSAPGRSRGWCGPEFDRSYSCTRVL